MSDFIFGLFGLIVIGLMLFAIGQIFRKIFQVLFGKKKPKSPPVSSAPRYTKEQLMQRDNEERAKIKAEIDRPFVEKPDGLPFFLFFDVEATDLIPDYIDPKNHEHYPHPVQLAWSVFTYEGELIKERSFILLQYVDIPLESAKIHRITTEVMKEKGVDPTPVYEEFSNDLKTVKYMVAHNMDFDFKIMKAEFYRKGVKVTPLSRRKFCTMKKTKDFCLIPFPSGRGGYKYPKLSELAVCAFAPIMDPGRFSINGLHDAGMDVRVTAKCFFELLHEQCYFEIQKVE